MKEEWKKVKLGEVLDSIIGGGTPSKSVKNYWNGNLYWCSVKDMSDDIHYLEKTEDTITEEGLKNSTANLIKKGTVITATRMGLGRAFINKVDMTINQDLKALIPNSKIDNIYLLWTIIANRSVIANQGRGATVPGITLDMLKDLDINLPPLPTQQKIASILSAYDDLIENNRRQIKLLEEAALKLYKEWFVKLNFPGHETTKIVDGIPDGWKKEKISDWCRVFTGKKNANQNVEKGVYPFFTCAPDPLLSNDSLYEGKAVIISGNGSYTGRTQFYDGHFDLYQRTYACVKQKAVGYEYMPFIYYSMKVLFEPIKMGGTKGAAIPYIVMNDITDTEFLYNEEICKKYSGFAEITLDKIGALKKQIQLLQLARDKLLPKLMNGEIEV